MIQIMLKELLPNFIFNSFNLADDLIEPWRAMVDIVAHNIVSSQTNLSREQRKELTLVLHIQSEVFMRITNNRKGAEKHLNRIKKYIPNTGTVRILRLTEKQFCNMGLYQAEEDF